MGLLDDAIREHLELKRRRGADPNEVDRLEREALGPVRRGPHDASDAAFPDEPPGTALRYEDEQPGDDWPEAQEETPQADHLGPMEEVDRLEEWDAPERGPVQAGTGVEPDVAAPSPPLPPSPAEAPPASSSLDEIDYLEQETVEHDVETEHGEGAEQDDMLEETPEFLQDTPDHDRLWFEQRPPRDFDLDG